MTTRPSATEVGDLTSAACPSNWRALLAHLRTGIGSLDHDAITAIAVVATKRKRRSFLQRSFLMPCYICSSRDWPSRPRRTQQKRPARWVRKIANFWQCTTAVGRSGDVALLLGTKQGPHLVDRCARASSSNTDGAFRSAHIRLDRALPGDWGSRGRRFKSCRPDWGSPHCRRSEAVFSFARKRPLACSGACLSHSSHGFHGSTPWVEATRRRGLVTICAVPARMSDLSITAMGSLVARRDRIFWLRRAHLTLLSSIKCAPIGPEAAQVPDESVDDEAAAAKFVSRHEVQPLLAWRQVPGVAKIQGRADGLAVEGGGADDRNGLVAGRGAGDH